MARNTRRDRPSHRRRHPGTELSADQPDLGLIAPRRWNAAPSWWCRQRQRRSPAAQLERLIAAPGAAAEDDSRPEEERSRFKQAILTLRGAAWQVALGALSGAGGNLMTGG